MMAVLVGIMLQISEDGLLAPSSLFFFCVAGEMIFTALLHPKEFNCIIYGVIYYVTVPSMYLLLVIYSIFNMNNVSWGTREVTIVKKSTEEVSYPQPQNKFYLFLFFRMQRQQILRKQKNLYWIKLNRSARKIKITLELSSLLFLISLNVSCARVKIITRKRCNYV